MPAILIFGKDGGYDIMMVQMQSSLYYFCVCNFLHVCTMYVYWCVATLS